MPLIAASDTAIEVAVSVAIYLLVAGPVLAICFCAMGWKDADAIERAVADLECFIELRERAHDELATTGSLDRFIELRDEARRHLWRPASERAQPEGRTSSSERRPVSRIVRPSHSQAGDEPNRKRAPTR